MERGLTSFAWNPSPRSFKVLSIVNPKRLDAGSLRCPHIMRTKLDAQYSWVGRLALQSFAAMPHWSATMRLWRLALE